MSTNETKMFEIQYFFSCKSTNDCAALLTLFQTLQTEIVYLEILL